jgi:peptidylprolyl isomerase
MWHEAHRIHYTAAAMKPIAAVLILLCAACAQPPADTVATTDTTPTVAMTETTAPPAAPAGAAMDTFSMPTNLQTTPSGLQYTIDTPGTGAQPQAGQLVTVHYTGWLTDGTKFDSSHDRGRPIEFPLGQGRVIKGWEEALAAMKVGEKRTIVIPPDLAYGAPGRGGVIPPNATLVFKVELVGVR